MPCRAALPQPQCRRRARAARAISARMRFDGAPVPLAGARPGGSRAAKVRLGACLFDGKIWHGCGRGARICAKRSPTLAFFSNGSFIASHWQRRCVAFMPDASLEGKHGVCRTSCSTI